MNHKKGEPYYSTPMSDEEFDRMMMEREYEEYASMDWTYDHEDEMDEEVYTEAEARQALGDEYFA